MEMIQVVKKREFTKLFQKSVRKVHVVTQPDITFVVIPAPWHVDLANYLYTLQHIRNDETHIFLFLIQFDLCSIEVVSSNPCTVDFLDDASSVLIQYMERSMIWIRIETKIAWARVTRNGLAIQLKTRSP